MSIFNFFNRQKKAKAQVKQANGQPNGQPKQEPKRTVLTGKVRIKRYTTFWGNLRFDFILEGETVATYSTERELQTAKDILQKFGVQFI